MTRYHVILSSYDIDTESKKRISTKKQTNNQKKKQKKNKSFFLQHAWGWSFFLRDNVRLFMKESAVFTRDEPKASKGMQA